MKTASRQTGVGADGEFQDRCAEYRALANTRTDFVFRLLQVLPDMGPASPVVRHSSERRRQRPAPEPGQDPWEPHRRQQEAVEGLAVHPEGRAARQNQGPFSGTLNKCILLALLIAISMGFGHFYGTVQIQERQRIVEKSRV
ncbi:cell cycle progression protein 1-like [Cyprinus carpio]|uniref:Cell cycle progression protein 1-like n=1 Tax=Cyprinus carpio TaxID=7962 RepID=A0A9Q9Y0T4_CYPCA|nr:cell cycle progression protein 1-like [Cyprinus carpio]